MPETPPKSDELDEHLARYSRQVLFEEFGAEGQRRLLEARVTLIGCGALGTVLADTLTRAGVGHLRICDRDFIEFDNLQRQVLFDEDDIAANLPKAEAAARKLRRINSQIEIESVVADVNYTNIEGLTERADLLLDGTDNFETRYLINDLAVKSSRPWIYGAVIGATGLCMPILPGETPCLRCVFAEAPPPEMNPTCDTAGVLGPVVHLVAGMQALEAIKILSGHREAVNRHLVSIDGWSGRITNLNVAAADATGECTCCKLGEFEYLEGRMGSRTTTLCGRNAVQVSRTGDGKVDLVVLGEKLDSVANGAVAVNEFMLRCRVGGHEITLFADGRAIIKGTGDVDTARSLYARYIGS